MENKMEIIDQIRKLCSMTRALSDIVIETGFRDYEKKEFVQSSDPNKVIDLLFRWKGQDRQFGQMQSIEADSGWGIILDSIKTLKTMA